MNIAGMTEPRGLRVHATRSRRRPELVDYGRGIPLLAVIGLMIVGSWALVAAVAWLILAGLS